MFDLFLTRQKSWKKGDRKDFRIKCLKATDQTKISVLGQNDKVVEYEPNKDATTKFKQTDNGLKISVLRAQRLYNNYSWPNPVVVKLENVEFIKR